MVKLRPSKEASKIRAALAVLEKYGRSMFHNGSCVSTGTAVGAAIYSVMGAQDCVMMAVEALEQWNAHLAVAAIAAIEQGKGTVHREGRHLTITLPEWWDHTCPPATPSGKMKHPRKTRSIS
jgi:hypothetical protein